MRGKVKINLERENRPTILKDFILKLQGLLESSQSKNNELKEEIKKLEEENKELKKKLNLSPEFPASPSGAKPGFIKPDTKKKHKNPGRKKGYKGRRGKGFSKGEITEVKEEILERCSDCGTKFTSGSKSQRGRVIIDIKLPEELDVVEHKIHQYWCTVCKGMKEKVIAEALSGFTIGIKTVVYTAFQHYYQGISISKILQNLKIHGMRLTEGALVGQWHSLAELFRPFYNEIQGVIRNYKGAVYADETSYRQKGKKQWLWSFSTKEEAFFALRDNRSGKVVLEILGKLFPGILVTDFWKPYLKTAARFRQWCVAHFLREFKKIEFRRFKPPPEYWKFKKKVVRLFKDALRFSKRKRTSKKERAKALKRFIKRLDQIVSQRYSDADVIRLVKRLKTYRQGFFTFVAMNNVDATNNHAERMIRFAVIMRKVLFHTMSDKGSETMSILMSVFKTIDLRGENVFQTVLHIAKEEIAKQKSANLNLAA